VGAAASVCDGVVVVLPAGVEWDGMTSVVPVTGGASRSESVRSGLAALPPEAEIVVVHDAARPLASPTLFRAVVAAVEGGADGAVPGVGVSDTIKRVAGDGAVLGTVLRDGLVAVQTPQAFRAAILRSAHAAGGEASDDAALVEAAGGRVMVVPGDPANTKITLRTDLV
jgi:2-C-methyl-D-erythritol 4-phosphate cytidylyltransferase